MVPGRDQAWYEETLANVGEFKFRQEYCCEFISADHTLINPQTLMEIDFIEGSSVIEIPELSSIHHLAKWMEVFELPQQNHCYSVGFDSSKMTELKSGDSISFHVLDVTELPFRQVFSATIKSGVSYLELPSILAPVIAFYKAKIFIENNGEGQEIANNLVRDFDMVEEVFCEVPGLTGFRTTSKTKRFGTAFLKLLLENSKLIVRDKTTISQLTTFVKRGSGFSAEPGFYDDAVMALIAAIFFLQLSDDKIGNLFDDMQKFPDKLSFMSEVMGKKVVNALLENVKTINNRNRGEFGEFESNFENQAEDISFNFEDDDNYNDNNEERPRFANEFRNL
jgi:hypothetical protein